MDQYCYLFSRSTEDTDHSVDLDTLNGNDWNALIRIKAILKPFYSVTKHLEGNAVDGTHGALWEVVMGLECLVDALQQIQIELANDIGTHDLNICVGLAIGKLEEHLGKTNRSAVWLAALVLHPRYKWENLEALWSGHRVKRSLYQASKARVQNLWCASYKDKVVLVEDPSLLRHNPDSDNDDVFHKLMHRQSFTNSPLDSTDEYTKYITKERDEDFKNPLQWWRDHPLSYPNLAQMANDLFAIPAMSSECERSFSKASYTIAARRSNLNGEIIEAGEALRSWVISDVVELSTPV